ncbi:GMC family oxidoreductase N-terminal domain-containing protein [Acrocarpospora catenulata]|uniref:GMC family oxidoreductase N-terminal domain-containing protein n=1 Tax=Acrocarpospora catenulata TaxID=2836182 RepID=UPI001BD9CF16|nr:GMC family oxidoreductase N-terminal domain-containing protein [Acrocarpospora catenulata]
MKDRVHTFGRRDALRLGAGAVLLAGLDLGTAQARTDLHTDPDEADYVIIGSGPGGTPLAANLAAAGFTVLVLEAGPAEGDRRWYDVPVLSNFAVSEDTRIRWDFYVQHYSDLDYNATCSQWVTGRGVLYPRASALGGCTAHNATITMAADPADWAFIQRLTGDDGWNPETMWGHWERFLSWQPTEFGLVDIFKIDPQLGRIVASAVTEAQALPGGGDVRNQRSINDRAFVDAGTQGFFYPPQSTRHGKRHSMRERLLSARAAHPSRLIVRTGALAERVVLAPGPDGRRRAAPATTWPGSACPSRSTCPAWAATSRTGTRCRWSPSTRPSSCSRRAPSARPRWTRA